jgi:hypothetical protein
MSAKYETKITAKAYMSKRRDLRMSASEPFSKRHSEITVAMIMRKM